MQLDQQKNVRRIIVEGNIGAGKSTFLRLLQENFSAQFIFEPHEEWQNIGGHNLLDKFYTDKERWAYTFQSYAFITRMRADEQGVKTSSHNTHILERSVFSDRYCFAKNCYEMGVISTLEWKLYQEWFEWLIESRNYRPDGFIYLQTDPEVCFQRMLIRNRSEESTVSIDYLTMIHQKHEDWLIAKTNVPLYLKNVPVLTLECNTDFEHNSNEQEKHFSAIQTFFDIPLLNTQKSCVTALQK
jgi:deoxyadenosine/deoxycytidine kinase